MITVRVVEVGGAFNEVEIEDGSTVRDALEAAGVNTNVAKQLRVDMQEATLDTVVRNNQMVYVVPNIKGNRS